MKYTAEQIEFLKSISYMNRIEATKIFNDKFGTNKTHAAIKTWFVRQGLKWDSNRSPKPLNAGNFKLGHKAHNAMKIGDEYIHPQSGLVMVKTEAGRVFKHHHIWGEEIPEGYNLTFKDGNKLNCHKENLMLVKKADLLRFNQNYAHKANEVNRETYLLLAQIKTERFKHAG